MTRERTTHNGPNGERVHVDTINHPDGTTTVNVSEAVVGKLGEIGSHIVQTTEIDKGGNSVTKDVPSKSWW